MLGEDFFASRTASGVACQRNPPPFGRVVFLAAGNEQGRRISRSWCFQVGGGISTKGREEGTFHLQHVVDVSRRSGCGPRASGVCHFGM